MFEVWWMNSKVQVRCIEATHTFKSQSSNSQAASSHQSSSTGNNASSNASTYCVSRIAYADTDTCADELTFDLGGLSDFGKLLMRAVRDESFSSQVGVEHFSPPAR